MTGSQRNVLVSSAALNRLSLGQLSSSGNVGFQFFSRCTKCSNIGPNETQPVGFFLGTLPRIEVSVDRSTLNGTKNSKSTTSCLRRCSAVPSLGQNRTTKGKAAP